MSDHTFGGLLIIGHDILNAAAKCSFHCDLILFIYADNICHNSDNARIIRLLLHNTLDALPKPLIALCHILQRTQSGMIHVILSLRLTALEI